MWAGHGEVISEGVSCSPDGRHFSITNEREKLQGAAGSTHIVNKSTFFSQEVKLEHSGTFKGGNHELPFEFSIPGDTSESVEGLPGNFVVYELKAVADRGIMAKDLTARRNLRIIRMPREDSMELLDPQVSPLLSIGQKRYQSWGKGYKDEG